MTHVPPRQRSGRNLPHEVAKQEEHRKVSWIRSSLCKGPGVRVRGGTHLQTEGTEAGPFQNHLSGRHTQLSGDGSHTCPGLSTQQRTQAGHHSGLASCPGFSSLHWGPGTSHFTPEPHFLSLPYGLVGNSTLGTKGGSSQGFGPLLGSRTSGGEGHPAQPRSQHQDEVTGNTACARVGVE